MYHKIYNKSSSGFDIVLLHGWGWHSGIFTDWATKLNHRLHLIDIPGFGDSKPLESVTLITLAEQITAIIPKKSILCGWSFGGLLATYICSCYSDKINPTGLITITSSPCFTQQGNWKGISKQSYTNLYQNSEQDIKKTLELFLTLQTLNIPDASATRHYLKGIIKQKELPDLQTLQKTLRLLENTDLRHEFNELELPCLRIIGNKDPLVPPNLGLIESKNYTEIVLNAGHIPFLSTPNEFFNAIIKWINFI